MAAHTSRRNRRPASSRVRGSIVQIHVEPRVPQPIQTHGVTVSPRNHIITLRASAPRLGSMRDIVRSVIERADTLAKPALAAV